MPTSRPPDAELPVAAPRGAARRRSWVRRLLGTGIGLALVLALGLALLPTLVSTAPARVLIERIVAKAVNRPVRLERLEWSWSRGILLQGVRLEDLPAFGAGPLASLGTLRLSFAGSNVLARRAVVDLVIEDVSVSAVRATGGDVNWLAFLRGLPPSKPKPPKEGPFRLPLEVAARVRITRVSLSAEDRESAHRAALTRGRLELDAPSVRVAPSRLRLSFAAEADGRKLPDVELSVDAAGLFRPDGVLAPQALCARVRASGPGLTASLSADAAKGEGEARVAADLGELGAVVRPFLPGRPGATLARGGVRLDATARRSLEGAVAFWTAFELGGVTAQGGLVPSGTFGPFKARLSSSGSWEPRARVLALDRGELDVLDRSRLHWSARASALGRPEAAASAALGSVSLDLEELLGAFKPLLPANTPVLEGGRDRPTLALRAATLELAPLGERRGTLHLSDLSLRLPGMRAGAGAKPLSLSRLRFDSSELRVGLADGAPAWVDLRAGLRLARFFAPTARLEGVDVPSFSLSLRELRRGGGGGLSGRFSARSVGAVARAVLPGVRAERARHRLEAQGSFRGGALRELIVATASLSLGSGEYGARGSGDLWSRLAGTRKAPASVELRNFRAAGARLDTLSLGGAAVKLPTLSVRSGPNTVEAAGVSLALGRATGVLGGVRGLSGGVSGSLSAWTLSVTGPKHVQLAGVSIPSWSAALSDLRADRGAKLGATGRVSVRESLRIGAASARSVGEARGLVQEVDLDATLTSGGADVRVREAAASASRAVLHDRERGELNLGEGLEVRFGAPGLRVTSLSPFSADLVGASAGIRLGPLLRAEVTASLRDLGRGGATFAGWAESDLGRIPRQFFEKAKPGLRAGGRVALRWSAAGAMPRQGGALSALERLDLTFALEGGHLRLPSKDGALELSGVSTDRPLRLSLGHGGTGGSLDARFVAAVVGELPSAGPFDLPPSAVLSLTASGDTGSAVRVSQSLSVEPLGLRQELAAEITGLRRVLETRSTGPDRRWLEALGGSLRASLSAKRGSEALSSRGDLIWSGPVSAALSVALEKGSHADVSLSLETPGLEARLGELLDVRDLRSDLRLSRRVSFVKTRSAGGSPTNRFLSREVLEPPLRSAEAPREPRGVAEQLGRQFRGAPSLSFARARVRAAGVHLDLGKTLVDFRLDRGLPALEHFRLDALGGTVVGSAAVSRGADGFPLAVRVSFSGLNAKRLAPQLVYGVEDDEAEIGGQLALLAPLTPNTDAFVGGLKLDAELTSIGSQALDRLLYGLDPNESNEAILKQRRLLRMGTPRWVRLGIRDGMLSLTGELEVKGLRLGLPALDRVNLADLPGGDRLEKALAGLASPVAALRLASADTLSYGEDGELKFGVP